MNKDSKKNIKRKEKMKKNFIKFLNRRGSKSLPLTVFLAEKTEPNYDTDHDPSSRCFSQNTLGRDHARICLHTGTQF
jgi:hypothetical protein